MFKRLEFWINLIQWIMLFSAFVDWGSQYMLVTDDFQAGYNYFHADSNDERLILGRSAEWLEGYKEAWYENQPSYHNSWLDPDGIYLDQAWDEHVDSSNYACIFGCERDQDVCKAEECDGRREHEYMTGFGGEFE